jgi:hypothetical protein
MLEVMTMEDLDLEKSPMTRMRRTNHRKKRKKINWRKRAMRNPLRRQ